MMFCTDLEHIFKYIWKDRGDYEYTFFSVIQRGVVLTICVMLYLLHFLANSCRILGATIFLLFRVGYECIWECCARIMLV